MAVNHLPKPGRSSERATKETIGMFDLLHGASDNAADAGYRASNYLLIDSEDADTAVVAPHSLDSTRDATLRDLENRRLALVRVLSEKSIDQVVGDDFAAGWSVELVPEAESST
ncbi:hypothetical protein [Rhodococcus sp. IEGM 1330]|uniref:hypothetical protein n=1 Tax=Rhodococcus sp. IEGM 1330 TaxID=3082225 RepID=UPI002953701C|nr:hypothetical protein [Rhodococcus sp. IEGM 1330]MDV8022213.1 hypothetical protein [Rhodococcus sp. IEGM 1330]